MPSLKSRMAAFTKASTNSSPINSAVSPATKYSSSNSKTTSTTKTVQTTPKKLSLGRINAINNIVTPEKSSFATPVKKKPIDIRAGTNESQQPGSTEKEKEQANKVVPVSTTAPQDWGYLYELAQQFDQLKLQEAEEVKNPPKRAISPPKKHEQGDKQGIKGALEGLVGGNFTANGKFLDDEYIGKHLISNPKFPETLTFDFSSQAKLFKRFDRKDSERRNICEMFVAAMLKHPKSKDITALQMANCLLPDEFPEILAEQCMRQNGLPKLAVINMESNLLLQDGILGLAKAIECPNTWRKLQFLKLENQKMPLTSNAEEALGAAILQSPSLVVVSLRVRGGLSRQQINNTVAANIDHLRQARREQAAKTGTVHERKRNEMEHYFDKIAANNDPSIMEVDIVGNIKFLGLNPAERTKTGAAFATNTHVKTIKMVKLELDDAFCEAFAKAMAQNATIEKVVVDSNAFSGTGIKCLLEGLGRNTSITELQVRHQSKTTSSADEQALPALLANNNTLIKLGIDLRNQVAKMEIDRKLNENREYQRKMRAAAKKG